MTPTDLTLNHGYAVATLVKSPTLTSGSIGMTGEREGERRGQNTHWHGTTCFTGRSDSEMRSHLW
jgi:hypothetical protein